MIIKRALKSLFITALSITFLLTVFEITDSKAYTSARLLGPEYGETLLRNTSFNDIAGHWAAVSINRMAGQNIIRGYSPQSFRPDVLIPREQAIAVIIRAMGKEERAQRIALTEGENLQRAEEGATIYSYSPWSMGYLYQAQLEGIISEDDIKTLKWDQPAQRQEVAYWIARALHLPEIYGSDLQRVFNFNDWREIDSKYISYIESILKEGIMSGTTSGNFNPTHGMTRGEIAAVIDRARDYFLEGSGIKKEMGTVISAAFETEGTGRGTTTRNIFRVRTFNGELYDLVAEEKITNTWERESRALIVMRNGELGDASFLRQDDDVVFYIDNNNRVTFIEVTGFYRDIVEGEIKEIDRNSGEIAVRDYNGNTYRYKISPWVRPVIDHQEVDIKDLLEGQEITVTVINGTAVGITGFSGLEEGYIPPKSRIRRGRIRTIDDDSITIIDADGNEKEYRIGYYTDIIRGGSKINARDLRAGERVMLFFDEANIDEVSMITVGGYQGKVKAIYKGKLAGADARRMEIVMDNVKEYYFGNWLDYKSQIKLNLHREVGIFYNGRVITIDDLMKMHKNSYIYAAVLPGYGVEEGIKVIVKDNDEIADNGRISSISWIQGNIRVGRETIYINEGSIILKNGNLIDIIDIDREDDVFYLAMRENGVNKGVIVNTMDFYPTDYTIFKGNLNEIENYGFIIDSYSEYTGGSWSSFKSYKYEMEFSFSDDTTVIDTSKSTGNKIPLKDFKYARYTHEYYDDFIYVVAKGNKALGISIWPDTIQNEITSLGRVTSRNIGEKRVTLIDFKDWSAFREKWSENLSSLDVYLQDALIIKDDEVIDFEDLKIGDTLYLIRDNNQGIIAIVQNGTLEGMR
jgi:hypothetical protein